MRAMSSLPADRKIVSAPLSRASCTSAPVTARLVQDARDRGADVVFIEAADPDVARIYGRLGFERVGTACVAKAP